MTTSLASFALAILLAGTAVAQQKQPRRSSGNKSTSASSANTARSTTSTATPQEGSAGVAVGTGLTNDQQQGAANGSNGPTKVDAQSSVRTGPSPVKARKKTPKSDN